MIAPFSIAFQPRMTGFAYLAVTRGKSGQWYQASLPPGRIMIVGEWSGPKRARLRVIRGTGKTTDTVLDIPAGTGTTRIGPLHLTALDDGASISVDAYGLEQSDIDHAILSLSVIVIPFGE